MSGDAAAGGRRVPQQAARCAVLLLTVVVLGAGAVADAAASHTGGVPSAEELWRAYPLHPDRAASGLGEQAAVGNDAPRAAGNGRLMLQLGMVIGVFYAAFVCLWFMVIHPRVGYATQLAVAGASRRVPHHWVVASQSNAVWTCAIAWRAGRVRSRFRAFVVAPDGRRRRVIAQSRSVHWPPRSSESRATAELAAALESLVTALVAAGWEPVEPGVSWSARRFVWRHGGKPPGRLRLVHED